MQTTLLGLGIAIILALLERLVERALAMDVASTGEHGIGQGKVKYLRREHGEAALFSHARHQDGTGPA